MANHKSAEKRHRQNIKRRESNRTAKAAIRTTTKAALAAAEAGDTEKAKALAKAATSLLDKAAIHGTLHKNNAARHISNLNRRIGQ